MRPHRFASLIIAALACARPGAAPSAPDRPTPTPESAHIDLEVSGEGFPVYRIPALAGSRTGILLAAYDGRPSGADVPSDIALLLRRSLDGGATWLSRQVIRRGPAANGYGDPSFVVDRETGRIFLFHAASIDQGFTGSGTGNDDDDPAILQQYVVRFAGTTWAASAFSDDHGRSWRMGDLAGPGVDENKVVELADGRLMLNSRATPHRLVADSSDGGATWSALLPDSQLVDPGNNGSIIRYAPDAGPDDRRSRWLLFSNTAPSDVRRSLTVRHSCDGGRSWAVTRVIGAGNAAYSTLAVLPSGRRRPAPIQGLREPIRRHRRSLHMCHTGSCRC
ncbi:MAG TPA: sialidase family protein [Gemmatimonadales bacterium]|nr:sialidase family protein [Gemmatimonadales bacterium]